MANPAFSIKRALDARAPAGWRLPIGSTRPVLPVRAPVTCVERWRLGGGAHSLGGVIGGSVLSVQISPLSTWSENYMTTPNADNAGIYVPFAEANAETWILVFRFPVSPSGTTIVFGNMTGTAGDGGWGIFIGSGALKVTTYGLTTVTKTLSFPSGYVQGGFIALGVSQAAGSRIIQIRGGSAVTDTGGTRVLAPSRLPALEEQNYAPATAHSPLDVALLEYHATTLDAAALAAALESAALDCAERGLTVF